VVIASDIPGLTDTARIEDARKPFMDALRVYVYDKHGTESLLLHDMFALVPELRIITDERLQMTRSFVFDDTPMFSSEIAEATSALE